MLIKSGYSDPAMATADANTTGPFLDNFVSGKTGMIIMANWGELALKAGMGYKFAEIATAPIPVGPSGDKPRSISYSWITVANAKASAEEQKEAWDFLDWLNGPQSGLNGASAMGDILMLMGICRRETPTLRVRAAPRRRSLPQGLYRDAYRRQRVSRCPRRPGIFGSLQKTLEAMQFGQLSEKAQATAQADAAQILERNAK